jgi:hypothetical protein
MSLTTITSLRRGLSEWAERPANQAFLQRDQEAQLVASRGDARRRTQVHVAAWMLGTWHLGHGLWRVMEGDGDGFDAARQGQALRRCSLLLRERYQPAGSRGLPFSVLQGALTALLALALHDPGAEPLLDRMRRLPDSAFGDDDHLALFVRELLTLRAGSRPTVTPRLGPYQEVLSHWNSESRVLAQRLADVLELHLERARAGKTPFDDPAARLYPFEALAICHVRDWLGLSTPKIEHPLMFTNLGQMRPGTPWPTHDQVQRLEHELRRR